MRRYYILQLILLALLGHTGYTQTEIRINAGGDSLTFNGKHFNEDFYYSSPSQVSTYTKAIPEIYKSERYGNTNELNYDFPVSNGNYAVTLHFMESYFGSMTSGGVGSRVFDVSIEGAKVLDDFDIFNDVGADMPSIKQFNVAVNDGLLNIYFTSFTAEGGSDYAKICAIEVVEIINYGNELWSENNTNIFYDLGNVGIGLTDPGNDKLAVNGNIRAKEVKVETTNWPDYVFDKGYNLPSLEEIKKHIQEKGHLPNIPSASEMEENGVELGEMNKLLLEKIEELTLYILKQQEEIKENKRQIRLINDH
jgi:hypothetical protein